MAHAMINEYSAILIECRFNDLEFHNIRKVSTLQRSGNTDSKTTMHREVATGVLRIPWVSKKKLTSKNIPLNLVFPKDVDEFLQTNNRVCMVCGRLLHGDVNGESIAKQVEFLQYIGVGPLVLYEAGISYIYKESLLERCIRDGSLVLIDLRKTILASYGISFIYKVLPCHFCRFSFVCNLVCDNNNADRTVDNTIKLPRFLFRCS